MLSKQAEMSKYFNQGDEVQDATSAVQYAIYDNGDVRSSNNQLVRQIETSQQLTEEEKERLLQQHERGLHNIDT